MVVLSVMYLWIFTFYRNYQYEFFTVALYFTIRHKKRGIYYIRMFSFVLTRRNQLSTICRTRLSDDSDGFETTDCLECLQILNVLHMAGGSALKPEIGKQDNHTPDEKHKHAFPYSHIEESTIHQPQAGPPDRRPAHHA